MLEVARKRDLKKCWKTHVTNWSRDTCLQNLLPFRNELTELHEIWNIVSFTHSTNYCSHKYSLDSMCFDQEKLKVENFPKSVTRHMLIRPLCRIRIGHSRLTHAHIMDKHAEKPMCAKCNCGLSMKHLMVDCPKYQHERSSFLDGSTTEEIYNNSDRAIINFVKECGFLNLL